MIIRVYQIKDQIFLIIVRISRIYLFFLTRLVKVNVVPPLEPLISNSKIVITHIDVTSDIQFYLAIIYYYG
jgi:hypothetical protein